MRLHRPLVEQQTIRKMCSLRDNMTRKNNGENVVRVILLALAFFVVMQISTREPETKSKGARIQNAFVQ